MQTPQNIQAINESIAHWKEMRDNSDTTQEPIADDCALCALYNTERGSACNGCPVKEKTGVYYCHQTPFWKCPHAFNYRNDSDEKWKEWQTAAQAEIDFLESLLVE